ncbi:YeeE/YedE thiosulfate transporter family protein [Polymorphum gilvum]|uniref:YeeE/YedE family protein n=1 Tax=Polymorphum gilvum (strain LMG 25793 / CGMCC 1.9160 / SL003B-26A1) TaxID=991905 RepID=F2J4Y6_POLGS|nr:YeeE/YedE thiosulfate transporter family protein [Polymorphum gilvum]ADZ70028.1 YeeE/YedE family protein [Polymorphum gilvum SL003B-26A1]
MTLFWMIVLGLAMGLVFGIALEKSRVMEPGVLIGQFQFRTFIMLKMFLAATTTGLVVLAVLNGGFGVPLGPKAAAWGPVIVGGLILGAGIALAGACPGTALAQIGAGYKDAWAVVAGGILGAMFYSYNMDWIHAALDWGSAGKMTFVDLIPLPFWVLALIAAALLVVLMVVLEKISPSAMEKAGVDVAMDDGSDTQAGSARLHPAE